MIFDRLKGFWQRFFGADFAGGARPAIVSAEGGALSRRKLIMGIGIAGLCAAAGPSVLSSSAHAAEPEIDPDDLELAEAETEQEVAEASDELDEFSSQPRRRRRRRRPRGRRGPPRGRRRGPRRGSVAYRCRTSPAFRRRNRRTCRRVIGW